MLTQYLTHHGKEKQLFMVYPRYKLNENIRRKVEGK